MSSFNKTDLLATAAEAREGSAKNAVEALKKAITEAAMEGKEHIAIPCQKIVPGTAWAPDHAAKTVADKVIPLLREELKGSGLLLRFHSIVEITWGEHPFGIDFETKAETL